tara:strand:- start:312 stop:524 length:213 start_codon:yes stop_codon:yes gene_type:complete
MSKRNELILSLLEAFSGEKLKRVHESHKLFSTEQLEMTYGLPTQEDQYFMDDYEVKRFVLGRIELMNRKN